MCGFKMYDEINKISCHHSLCTDLGGGYAEHLASLRDTQTVGERASILQPGQRGRRDAWGLTLKLQGIIYNYRYFCYHVRAIYAWGICWDTKGQKINTSLLSYEQKGQNLIFLTEHFQVEVAASLTSSVISNTSIASCIVDMGLGDLHTHIQVQESEVGCWEKSLAFFEPGHGGGRGSISNTQQRNHISPDYNHVFSAPCSIQTRRDWDSDKRYDTLP